jgi:hypothetical protein
MPVERKNERAKALRLRTGVITLLAANSLACSSWQTVTPSPEAYLSAKSPEEIRVTRLDSSRVVVRAPKLQSDSIVGTTGGGLKADDPLRSVGVPLPDVAKIESRHTDTGMVLGVLGIAMLVGFVAFQSSGGVMGE